MPERTPYWLKDKLSNGCKKGRSEIIRTPKRAVKAIEAATSSCFALITGAVATIAELPQRAFPQATNIDKFLESPRRYPIKKLIRIVIKTINTMPASKLQPAEKIVWILGY